MRSNSVLPQGGAKRSQIKNQTGSRRKALGKRGVTLLAASTLAQTASMAARSSSRFCFFSFALLDFLCKREKQSGLEGGDQRKTGLDFPSGDPKDRSPIRVPGLSSRNFRSGCHTHGHLVT